MKLNLKMCTFNVKVRKFLGFILTRLGKKANPAKCQAIINMKSPMNVREVQALSGRLTILTQFISKSDDKDAPLFNLLKNNKTFEWTNECEEAFKKLKSYLVTPPILNLIKVGRDFIHLSNNLR